MQPFATYSRTFARHSSAVPEAVISCTTSSGTRCIARSICSGVAGQVRICADLLEQRRVDAARLHDVRLLAEVLRHELARAVERDRAVGVERADDELRPVDVVDGAAGARGALGERRHRLAVVAGPDEVVEQHAVADLAGERHHLHRGRADVDRDVLRRAVAVDDVDLDVVEVHELAVEGDALHREQPPRRLDRLAHRLERVAAVDADLRRERLPPRADPELDPARARGRRASRTSPRAGRRCASSC